MMIFIYHDFAGTHSTSLAAAYHLKLLTPTHKNLTADEILSVPYFNKLTKKDVGKLIFHGEDEDGNRVYTVARRRFKQIVPLIKDFYLLIQEKSNINEKIILSNTSPTVPLAMTFGVFFSRGLKIDFIGVPLLIKGAQQSSELVYKLVDNTKKVAIIEKANHVIILENREFKA